MTLEGIYSGLVCHPDVPRKFGRMQFDDLMFAAFDKLLMQISVVQFPVGRLEHLDYFSI